MGQNVASEAVRSGSLGEVCYCIVIFKMPFLYLSIAGGGAAHDASKLLELLHATSCSRVHRN